MIQLFNALKGYDSFCQQNVNQQCNNDNMK